jgi:hypothetical protein
VHLGIDWKSRTHLNIATTQADVGQSPPHANVADLDGELGAAGTPETWAATTIFAGARK